MPSRSILKIDTPNEHYHVYARGVSRGFIFLDDEDHQMFLCLIARYLSLKPAKDKSGRMYPHLRGRAELLAYCLMGNHFHMLLYQSEQGSMKVLMQALLSSYTRYFNVRHKRSGPLFESRYKASMISTDVYLLHASRYIHLNRKDWRTYAFSSIHSYAGISTEEYLQPDRVLQQFKSREEYLQFIADYEDRKQELDILKYELADS